MNENKLKFHIIKLKNCKIINDVLFKKDLLWISENMHTKLLQEVHDQSSIFHFDNKWIINLVQRIKWIDATCLDWTTWLICSLTINKSLWFVMLLWKCLLSYSHELQQWKWQTDLFESIMTCNAILILLTDIMMLKDDQLCFLSKENLDLI